MAFTEMAAEALPHLSQYKELEQNLQGIEHQCT